MFAEHTSLRVAMYIFVILITQSHVYRVRCNEGEQQRRGFFARHVCTFKQNVASKCFIEMTNPTHSTERRDSMNRVHSCWIGWVAHEAATGDFVVWVSFSSCASYVTMLMWGWHHVRECNLLRKHKLQHCAKVVLVPHQTQKHNP